MLGNGSIALFQWIHISILIKCRAKFFYIKAICWTHPNVNGIFQCCCSNKQQRARGRESRPQPNNKSANQKDIFFATMLYLLCDLHAQLKSEGVNNLKLTAVHLHQMQPGYDGKPLVHWLENLLTDGSLDAYEIIAEDTYSIVIDKTPENKVYCSMCSRLRRGILYTCGA